MASEAIRPMLATAGPLPTGPDWGFEFAWDGIRSLAEVGSDGVRLLSRTERDVATSYPELDALRGRDMMLDGKIVALDAYGRPSFTRLQRRMNVAQPSASLQQRVPVAYYVFDVLRLDERSTLQLTYRQRRELLDELGIAGGPVVLPPYFLDTDGDTVLATAAQYGLHGVVAKRAGSAYLPGRRSRSWVETSLRHSQEVIVGGWVPGARGRPVGALLVGVPSDHGLRYVGQVGTGFTDAGCQELLERLGPLEQRASPFLDPPRAARVRWVAPQLQGEVAYRHWTHDGRLGHPTWRGLRPGKHPAAVRAPVVVAERAEGAELDEAVREAAAQVDRQPDRISPHFFYNAVSAIASLVRTDAPRARELLIEFAHFTRYSMRSATESTLAAELENVERYLTLQQARLGERLRATTRVAPAVLGVTLPFLSLQLLAEHAVEAIEDAPDGGAVALTAEPDGPDCVVTVEGPAAAPGVRLLAMFGDALSVDAAGTLRVRVRSRAGTAPLPS